METDLNGIMDKLPLILDCAAAAVVLFWMIWKGERGLCRCLVPLAATLLSLAGAAIVSTMFRDQVTEAVFPWVREQLGARIDLTSIRSLDIEDITRQLGQLLPRQLMAMGESLNLPALRELVETAMDSIPRATAQRVAESAMTSMLYPIVSAAVRVGLFAGAFLVLRVVLGLVSSLLGLVANFPIIRPLDVIAGMALGLVEAVVIVWLFCAVSRWIDVPMLSESLEQTRLLKLLL